MPLAYRLRLRVVVEDTPTRSAGNVVLVAYIIQYINTSV